MAVKFYQYSRLSIMPDSFLEYYKVILQKVSFDQALFRKELNKAFNSLNSNEAAQLRNWLITSGLLPGETEEPNTAFLSKRLF